MLAIQFIPDADQLAQLNDVAHTTLAPAWAWASDFAIIIVPTLLLVVFSRYAGRGPFIALVTSLYVGFALFTSFPYLVYLPSAPALTAFGAQVVLFLTFVIVGYLILRRVAASDFVHISTLGLLVVSLASAGFLMTLLYHVFPTHAVYAFSPGVDTLFASKNLFYAWLVAPLLTLFIFAH